MTCRIVSQPGYILILLIVCLNEYNARFNAVVYIIFGKLSVISMSLAIRHSALLPFLFFVLLHNVMNFCSLNSCLMDMYEIILLDSS